MQGYSVAECRRMTPDILALGNTLAYQIVLHQKVLLTCFFKCILFRILFVFSFHSEIITLF